MSDARKPMTLQGKKMLEKELKHLVDVERPSVISAIERARAHGDLSENADYLAAKERQSHIEGRIAGISHSLSNAEVVDTSKLSETDRVTFGAYISLQDEENKKVVYQIVGEDEADVKQGKISINSPLARSVIGRKKGDEFEFHSPKGEKSYCILEFYFK